MMAGQAHFGPSLSLSLVPLLCMCYMLVSDACPDVCRSQRLPPSVCLHLPFYFLRQGLLLESGVHSAHPVSQGSWLCLKSAYVAFTWDSGNLNNTQAYTAVWYPWSLFPSLSTTLSGYLLVLLGKPCRYRHFPGPSQPCLPRPPHGLSVG